LAATVIFLALVMGNVERSADETARKAVTIAARSSRRSARSQRSSTSVSIVLRLISQKKQTGRPHRRRYLPWRCRSRRFPAAGDHPLLERLTPPIPEIAAEYWIIVHRDLRRAACVRAAIDWVKALFAEQRDVLAGSVL
jgi:hypothetical protein